MPTATDATTPKASPTATKARKGQAPASKSDKPAANGKPAKAETAAQSGADRKAAIRSATILLKQVSDATRLEILTILAEAPIHVGALCERLGNQSQPAVSHHVALLRHGRLIEPVRRGKENHYSLTEEGKRLVECVRGLVDGAGRGEG
jgi:DNA-binding transcriptional ArsR family regulator